MRKHSYQQRGRGYHGARAIAQMEPRPTPEIVVHPQLATLLSCGSSPAERRRNGFDAISMLADPAFPINDTDRLPELYNDFVHQPSGVYASAEVTESFDDCHLVEIALYTADDTVVGHARRRYGLDEQGRQVAYHDNIKLLEDFQQQGIASSLNQHLFAQYRQMGVHRMELNAVGDGIAVWAGMDNIQFDPRDKGQSNREFIDDLPTRLVYLAGNTLAADCFTEDHMYELQEAGHIDQQLVSELPRLLAHRQQLLRGEQQATWATTPQQIWSFGREQTWQDHDGRTTWLGKDLLTHHGNSWNGVLFFDK